MDIAHSFIPRWVRLPTTVSNFEESCRAELVSNAWNKGRDVILQRCDFSSGYERPGASSVREQCFGHELWSFLLPSKSPFSLGRSVGACYYCHLEGNRIEREKEVAAVARCAITTSAAKKGKTTEKKKSRGVVREKISAQLKLIMW